MKGKIKSASPVADRVIRQMESERRFRIICNSILMGKWWNRLQSNLYQLNTSHAMLANAFYDTANSLNNITASLKRLKNNVN